VALLFVCSDTQYDLNIKCDDDVRLHMCSEFHGEFKSRLLSTCSS